MSLVGKVGLNVNANYDTQSTFFQNLIKLEYAPPKMILFKN
jgi:hypothetical protein